MGIPPSDFWNMTLQDILNAYKGYEKRQIEEWRRVRWMATIFANVNGNKKKPTDLMRLPGDEEEIDISEEIEKIKERRKWRTEH